MDYTIVSEVPVPMLIKHETNESGMRFEYEGCNSLSERLQRTTKVLPQQTRMGPHTEVRNTEEVLNSQMEIEHDENYENETIESDKFKLVIENQDSIMTMQTAIIENQMRIMEQLAKHDAMLELLCNHKSNAEIISTVNQVTEIPTTTEKISTPDPFPIDTIDKLETLDTALKDDRYMKLLVASKSNLFGNSGKMNGLNCSYTLIDHFFTRQFMTLFSWCGGSRKEEGKYAFKMYKNVMKTFYNIISKADGQFTEIECESFFKGVIKNSKRRSELPNNGVRRASTRKNRPKRLTYRIGNTPYRIDNKENDTQKLLKEHEKADEFIAISEESGNSEETEETESDVYKS